MELDEIYIRISNDSPMTAKRWYSKLLKEIQSLSHFPRRFGLAPEDFKEEVRQMLHGNRGHVYRVLYTIRDEVVNILHVRHGARRWIKKTKTPAC